MFRRCVFLFSEKYVLEFSDEGEIQEKYYLLDTNVFIDSPGILSTFSSNEHVILPVTVEQELEYRMSDVNTKYSAEKALPQLLCFQRR